MKRSITAEVVHGGGEGLKKAAAPQLVGHKTGLLVLCQLFYPELVSTGQTMTELCEALSRKDVEIEVLCGPPTILMPGRPVERLTVHEGIRIRRVPGTSFPKLSLPGKLINQLTYAASTLVAYAFDRTRCPVLVLTNPPFLAGICAFFRKLGGRPYIYVVFDVYPETAVVQGMLSKGGPVAALWNALNRFCFRHASAVVVIGRCMESLIEAKAGPLVRGKLHRIHVWSDDTNLRPVPKEDNPFVKRWGLEGKFVVSYSGNMGRFHDMETIMQAARILKERQDIVFLFIGDGQKKKWAEEFARAEGLGNCRFYGYVEREELPLSLSAADVGLASLMPGQEGLSVPSKTYGLMAAGVPVIAIMSGRSEVALVLKEEGCGLVVAPGAPEDLAKAILLLYNNKLLAREMGLKARRAIDEKYSLGVAAEKYLDLIRRVSL